MPNSVLVNGETHQRYLGDGVYASHDGYQIWLRTERLDDNYGSIIHEIALDYRTLDTLLQYINELKQMSKSNEPK
jgi:hypothetical protein